MLLDWPHLLVVVLLLLAFGFAIGLGGGGPSIRAQIRKRLRFRMPKIYRIARHFKTLNIAPGVRIHEGLRGKRDGHPYFAFVIHNRFGDPPEVTHRWETHFVCESGIDIGRLIAGLAPPLRN